MTYDQALAFLYERLPMYQRMGSPAFKKSLDNTLAFCKRLGYPERKFRSLHVAGTNGKGSCSHMAAAVLQSAGLKTGLYTSPHLKSFTERIRVAGQEVEQGFVVDFVKEHRSYIEKLQPSFFEVTVAMAFERFATAQVDCAVIEVGLGGRLDSTNVIVPEACLITNIDYDHMEMLGETLPEIAFEKAGIIKPGVPVVIGRKQAETQPVFEQVARERGAPLRYAEDLTLPQHATDLLGDYQAENVRSTLALLKSFDEPRVTPSAIEAGLANVVNLTGLKGRWQVIGKNPLTVADVAHNEAGLHAVVEQIGKQTFEQLHIVLGLSKEKKSGNMLKLLPKTAQYYFCKPNVPRGREANELHAEAASFGLQGKAFTSVEEAYRAAREAATPRDMVFIGGSAFVVAELEEV